MNKSRMVKRRGMGLDAVSLVVVFNLTRPGTCHN